MAWSPPAGVVPVDRKSPSVALYTDIPAMLDWLRTYYPGHTVVGVLATARDQKVTYRVDGEPGYGTPGTLSNYTLTKVDWGRAEVDIALAGIAQATAAANTAADIIGAAGLVYIGVDTDGFASVAAVEPRVTVTTETTPWAVIDGTTNLTAPVLTIGGL